MPCACRPPHHRRVVKIQDACLEGGHPGISLVLLQNTAKVSSPFFSSVMSDHSISCRSRHVAEEPGPTCLARERGCSVVTDRGGGVTKCVSTAPGAGGAAARSLSHSVPVALTGEENASSGWFPPGAQGRLP